MKETTDNLPKLLESQARIRFEDCDPFGHLNNGRYFDYFLNAREDQLRDHYGLDIYGHIKENGNAWVVSATQIAYLREVKFMEVVTIRTSLRWYTSSDLMMEGLMLDAAGTIKSVIWMRFAYINTRTGRKAEHTPQLEALFKSVALEGEGNPGKYFEDRVKELRMVAVAG